MKKIASKTSAEKSKLRKPSAKWNEVSLDSLNLVENRKIPEKPFVKVALNWCTGVLDGNSG